MDVNIVSLERLFDIARDFTQIITEPNKLLKIGKVKLELEDLSHQQKIKHLKEEAETYKEISITLFPNSDLTQRAFKRMAYEECTKQLNIENIISKTINYLPEHVSEEKVSEGFKNRFFDKAKFVSDDEAQETWAKILAGEIEKPGSYSYRTLDILSNLTQGEAKIFEKVAQSFIYNYIFFFDQEFFTNHFGIKYKDILLLSEIGLLHSLYNSKSSMSFNYDIPNLLVLDSNTFLAIKSLRNDHTIHVPCDIVTKPGMELSRLIKKRFSEKNLIYLSERFYTLNSNILIGIARIEESDGKEIKTFNNIQYYQNGEPYNE